MQRMLFVKRKYLSLYEKGKDLEVRTRNFYSLQIRPGDTVLLSKDGFERRVKSVRFYPDFPAMLQSEDSERIAPGYSKEIILKELRTAYSSFAERNGVLVFELEPLSE